MRSILLVLMACTADKSGLDSAALDEDGDGLSADEDCDDHDPSADYNRDWYGELTLDAVGDLCTGSCGIHVYGDLVIQSTDATDLAALSCVDFVDGGVTISDNAYLTDLSGLNGLWDIGPDFTEWEGWRGRSGAGLEISDNPALEVIDGFESLTRLANTLFIENNASLKRIAGFPLLNATITSYELQHVRIAYNPELEVIDGFESLELLGYIDESSLVVTDNDSLTAISGFGALGELEELIIAGNDSLTDLSGLGALEELQVLEISHNSSLSDISMFNDIESAYTVTLSDNASLQDISGMNRINADGGNLWELTIKDAPALTRISGLSGLGAGQLETADVSLSGCTSLGDLDFLTGVTALGSLQLVGEHALTDLSGLEGLTTLEYDLDLEDNDGLVDVSALYGLESVGRDVTILDNDALPEGAASALVDEIGTIGGEVEVQD